MTAVQFELADPAAHKRRRRLIPILVAVLAVTTLIITSLAIRGRNGTNTGTHDIVISAQIRDQASVVGIQIEGWVAPNQADLTVTFTAAGDGANNPAWTPMTRLLGDTQILVLRYVVNDHHRHVADITDGQDPSWEAPTEGDPLTTWDPTAALKPIVDAWHAPHLPSRMPYPLTELPGFDLLADNGLSHPTPPPPLEITASPDPTVTIEGSWLHQPEGQTLNTVYGISVADTPEHADRVLPNT